MPKTSVGKFDKKRVRSDYADGTLEVHTLGTDSCRLGGPVSARPTRMPG